jgi:hypothetical protein
VGCSHRDQPAHPLRGWRFHLVVSNDADIERIVTSLRDKFKVAFVAPGHCTGEPSFTALKRAFSGHYLYAGLGTTFALGPTPNPIAAADQNAVTRRRSQALPCAARE